MTSPPSTGSHLAYAMPHTAGDSGASFFHDHPPRPQDSTSVLEIGRRKRIVVIVVSAAVVVAIGIALLVMLGLDRDSHDPAPVVTPVDKPVTDPDKQPIVAAPTDAAVAAAAIVDAAVVAPADGSAVPVVRCFVDVKSVPSGAEIMREGNRDHVLGTTPTRLELPCGAAVKLVARKKGLANARDSVTPTPKGAAIKLAFPKNLMVVKVSSSPPGATIMMGSKNLGITPGTIKLPAFETATITLDKAGYQVEARKVVPKANNTSVHATLTRKRR
ncbi:MAG: PEGA domain-containing protein [Kofleriaceae bacterium]